MKNESSAIEIENSIVKEIYMQQFMYDIAQRARQVPLIDKHWLTSLDIPPFYGWTMQQTYPVYI